APAASSPSGCPSTIVVRVRRPVVRKDHRPRPVGGSCRRPGRSPGLRVVPHSRQLLGRVRTSGFPDRNELLGYRDPENHRRIVLPSGAPDAIILPVGSRSSLRRPSFRRSALAPSLVSPTCWAATLAPFPSDPESQERVAMLRSGD